MERNGYITWHNLLAAIGGAAAIIAISGGVIGAMYAIYGRDMDQLRSEMNGLRARELAQTESDAYHRGGMDQKIADARAAIAALDATLQREMRLLDETQRAELDGLDRRLQGEIRTIAATITDFVTQNERAIDELNRRQQELMEFRAATTARTP